MHLLNVNLSRSSAINTAVYGNFSGPKAQEIVVAKGSFLELLRPDETGKVWSICCTPVFAIIRSLVTYRIAGSNRDYIVIGSDSGKISIAEYDVTINEWKLIHCETYGKTGCRRIVPGQYLACDPKGRAIMIGSLEKQKFVYVISRDSANRLTISSPLDAHRADTIVFSTIALDVHLDNPIFAMIEVEYTAIDQDTTSASYHNLDKKLTYYELDLGLNHVVRKWSEPISRTANFLLSVPGGDDGPSGVLICGENWISYKHQNHPEVRAALPRRHNLPKERGVLITTGTMSKLRDSFFFLLQSEYGDLYKVTLDIEKNGNSKIVNDVIITVFDTIPLANSLCITKNGLLFAASEAGNHSLFQIQGMGDDGKVIKATRIRDEALNESLGDDSISACQVAVLFKPSNKCCNIALYDDILSLAPITDLFVDDLVGEETPQIHALCGRNNRSSLRILRHGISVSEMAVSELPGRPVAVWTVKATSDSTYDKYIVVSFFNATLVLSIGETVEEVTSTGFLATAPTLQVVVLADNALLQIHSQGIRHIRSDQRTSEWKTPGKQAIDKASANSRQVAISLAGGEIYYFELDASGMLTEVGSCTVGKEVSSLDLGLVPTGRSKSSFLAVGCWDDTVQLLSLDPSDVLTQRSVMSVPSRPDSVCLISMTKERVAASSSSASSSHSSSDSVSTLFLNVGLANGVILRASVDSVTGALSDSRQRFLGPKSVKIFRILVQGQQAIIALTTRPWLMYNYQGRYFQTPISYEALEYASGFSSEVCPEGIIAITGNTLRIITVENLGSIFNQTSYSLKYTPRKMCRLPGTSQLVIIETDHNEYNESETKAINDASRAADDGMHVVESSSNSEGDGDGDEDTIVPIRGPVPAQDGKWASCVRIVHAKDGTTRSMLELTNNEAAFSVCTCKFIQHSEETFIIVGTATNLTLHPRKISQGHINVYRVIDNRFQLLHQTEVEDVPMSMTEFQGKLLVGVGKTLRLYELGKKKLLRKCENKLFPTAIVRLQSSGNRIYVGDMAESVHFVIYKTQENVLSVFADDSIPRFITSLTVLDYNTVGCGDKFGNVFVLRLPDDVNDDVDSSRSLLDQCLNTSKAELLTHYYLGEAVTCIQKCTLVVGGVQSMVISTITGGIYALVPFSSKADITFFQHLETFLRQEYKSLCGRCHLSFRSYFNPVKNTVDGDLCERFSSLSLAKQKEFADDVDRTVIEVLKKLEEARCIL